MEKPRGLVGLINLGSTSYQCAVVQLLMATGPFVNFFLSGQADQERNTTNPLGFGGKLGKSFSDLANGIWLDPESVLNTWKSFKAQFGF